ncbi:response regulator [bacterium]|nr:response regulator [bacterium]
MADLTALDQLNLGVLDLDDQGRVEFANRTARRWLGQDLDRMNFSELLSSGSRLFFLNHLYPLIHTGQDLEEAYVSLKDAQGQELPVLLNANSLTGARKRLTFMPIRRRAIVEQQLLKAKQEAEAAVIAQQATLEALKEAQARLALQDRLAVMGTLAAGVAHELNNPLAYVMGNLEFLRGAQLDEEERLSLEDIKEGVRRIHGIVASLKVLSRSDDERKVALDLNHMGQIASHLSSKECANCCRLESSWHPSPIFVLGDEGKVTQVLLNLMLNACQAFTRPDLEKNCIQVRTWVEGTDACLEISDNGPGVPEELRSCIFDAFFTTKPVGSGTGLGLSICQGIVKSLGGRLELMPSQTGASFRVTLPLQQPPSSGRKAEVSRADRLEGLDCLIIDDDPKVARVLQRVLSRCQTQVALGGAKGQEVLRQEKPFDLIICDMMMPDVSGIEVYRSVSSQHQQRFVFVTGGVTQEDENFVRATGAPLLSKPFGPDKIVAAYAQLKTRARP